MSLFKIVVPQAADNLVPNPSFEFGTAGWLAAGAATISRDRNHATSGTAGLKVITTGTLVGEGAYTDPGSPPGSGLLALTSYTASADVYIPAGAVVGISVRELDGSAAIVGETTGDVVTGTGRWVRLQVTRAFGASGVGASILVRTISTAQAITLYVDAVQLEAGSEATTYFDGDRGNGHAWTGQHHASTSTRAGWVRAGGRVVDLADLGVEVESISGGGLPDITHLAVPYGAIPGQSFQRNNVGARNFKLKTFAGGRTTALHAARAAFIDAIKLDKAYPQQPFWLHYTGGVETVRIQCHALSYGNDPFDGFSQWNDLVLVADDPFWQTLGNSTIEISPLEELPDAGGIVMRGADGIWRAMAGGFDADAYTVYCGTFGPDGRVYIGGDILSIFNGAGGTSALTVNGVAVYDPATDQWSALNGGMNDTVYALGFAADGTLYAAGQFTTVNGGTATPATYFAKWNGSTWSAVHNPSSHAGGAIRAMAIAPDGNIYLAGEFTNWDGLPTADYIVQYNILGDGYGAVGSGAPPDGTIYALAIDRTGSYLYAAGVFTTIGGVTAGPVARYNLRAGVWQAMPGQVLDGAVTELTIDASNYLYAGGQFFDPNDAVYRHNGANWSRLGAGLASVNVGGFNVNALIIDGLDGSVLAGGLFDRAGGAVVPDGLARWTGSVWLPLDIDLPTGVEVTAMIGGPSGRLVVAFNADIGATTAIIPGSTETLENGGTTSAAAATRPTIRMRGPGTIEQIYNWTSRQGIYFTGLTLQPGEWLVITLGAGRVSLMSSWRGNCISYVAAGSDLINFELVPGLNTILIKFTDGTPTLATEASVQWNRHYWSMDVT